MIVWVKHRTINKRGIKPQKKGGLKCQIEMEQARLVRVEAVIPANVLVAVRVANVCVPIVANAWGTIAGRRALTNSVPRVVVR